MVGYPLREEPSVPFLDDAAGSYKYSFSTTPDGDKFIFRNSIYSPLGSSVGNNDQSPARRLTSTSQDFNQEIGSIRHGSTASEGGGARRKQNGTSIRDKSNQDIADHFLYQIPSLSPSKDGFGYTREGAPIRGGLVDATLTGEIYQNSESLVGETSFVENEPWDVDGVAGEAEHPKTDDEDTEIYECSLHVQSSFENKDIYQTMEAAQTTAAASSVAEKS